MKTGLVLVLSVMLAACQDVASVPEDAADAAVKEPEIAAEEVGPPPAAEGTQAERVDDVAGTGPDHAAAGPVPTNEAAGDGTVGLFELRAPDDTVLSQNALTVWSTNYYTPLYSVTDEGFPLIDRNNDALTGPLTKSRWCNVALQGSAAITGSDGTVTAYVFVDSNGPEQANCDSEFPALEPASLLATRKARFKPVRHPYGCGVKDWPLIPYRTIAVDRAVIPYETTLYIPRLAGKSFELDGVSYTHDGYVFAADRGGAIKDNHIDFFSGNDRRVPFTDVVTSDEDHTVEANIVPPGAPAALALKALHAKSCS